MLSYCFHHFLKASSQRSMVGMPTPRCTTRPTSSIANTMPSLKMLAFPWSKPYLNSWASRFLHLFMSCGMATNGSWFFPPICGIARVLASGSIITTGTRSTFSRSNLESPGLTPFASARRAFLSVSWINLALPATITARLPLAAWRDLRDAYRIPVSSPSSPNPLEPPLRVSSLDLSPTFIDDIVLTRSVALPITSRNSRICSFDFSFPLDSWLSRNNIPSAMPVLMAKFWEAWDRGMVSFPVIAPMV
mmetsp:Transcript_37400/g.72436  ORF Transcript_37400/g.72436 Transcript_37400/m.72436 type:complete len:248 (+) Transcript_37400:101-844(+)